jgi:hypothetical protein
MKDASFISFHQIHLSFSIIAFILSIVGVVTIIIELGKFWNSQTIGAIVHSILGLAATICLWINMIFGIWESCKNSDGTFKSNMVGRLRESMMKFKPTKAKSKRKLKKQAGYQQSVDKDNNTIYESTTTNNDYEEQKEMDEILEQENDPTCLKWMHWVIGNNVFWLGMAALVVAHKTKRSLVPCIFMYIAILQIIVHILTHIVMMVIYTYMYDCSINILYFI